MDWGSARHPDYMTENGVVTFDAVIHDWRKTSVVCNFDNTDVIVPSNAKYLTLTFHVLGDSGSVGTEIMSKVTYLAVKFECNVCSVPKNVAAKDGKSYRFSIWIRHCGERCRLLPCLRLKMKYSFITLTGRQY